MSSARMSRLRTDDSGLSLVELIVYAALTALLMSVVATLFASGLGAEAQTRDRDAATGRAQLIMSSLQSSIRNASEVRVDGDVVRAVVATGASGWSCEGWAVSGDRLVHRSSSSALALPTSDAAGWAVLADGVEPRGTGPAFTLSGRTLSVELAVLAGDATVPASGEVLAQAKQSGTAKQCW